MTKEIYPSVSIDPRWSTGVPVEVILGELAGGSSFEDVLQDYHLTNEQIRAALGYATQMLSSTMIYAAN